MLEQLKTIFQGKRVTITHNDKCVTPGTGICKTIHQTGPDSDWFEMVLTNGNRYGFVAENITGSSVDGPFNTLVDGRRKIELDTVCPAYEPSNQWTDEDRKKTILRVLEEISRLSDGRLPNVSRAQINDVGERIRFLVTASPDFLESNRLVILTGQ